MVVETHIERRGALTAPSVTGMLTDGAARVHEMLRALRRRPWSAHAVAVVTAAAWGLIVGWWMPRGPVNNAHAVVSVVVSGAVGWLTGLTTGSRWTMVLSPTAFAVAVEVARWSADGPTVDGVHLSAYGVIAFVVGRLFHGTVSLVPMLIGAALGAGASRWLTRTSGMVSPTGRMRLVRRAGAACAVLAMTVFTIALARPARTDAIVGADGKVVPGSVAELRTVELDGSSQSMMIRGYSVDNPVLLYLSGGPGGSELGAMRKHLPELERHFTVVTWDQPGTGKSYGALDDGVVTVDRLVADTLAVTDYLRQRFDVDSVYLVGQSWGSILGLLAVDRRPDLYTAFIGAGQMVSPAETDRIIYDDTLAWATGRGDDALVADLTAIGPPPYARTLDYETALSYEHEVYPYDHSANSEGEGGFSENFFVEEYTLVEQVHLLGAFIDSFSAVYPQIQSIDFRRDLTSVAVPVFFAQGAHEAAGRTEPFEEWYAELDAPSKDVEVFSTSGHRPLFEQPEEFVAYMVDVVLSRTSS
jgi:proline iminopeptidase